MRVRISRRLRGSEWLDSRVTSKIGHVVEDEVAAGRASYASVFRVRLHHGQSRVVVSELLQMCPGDLARGDRVVVGDVRLGVATSVLQLDLEAQTELLRVESRRRPVDPDLRS